MASLVRNNVSVADFFKNTIMTLSLYGFGSVDSLLNLKKYELEELKFLIQDDDMTELILMLHGYSVK